MRSPLFSRLFEFADPSAAQPQTPPQDPSMQQPAQQAPQQKQGDGIISPYDVSEEDNVAIAIDELKDDKETQDSIITAFIKKSSSIQSKQTKNMTEFRRLSNRISKGLALSNIFASDDEQMLREKLSDVLACCYAEHSEKAGSIFPKGPNTESKAKAVFNLAVKAGLSIKSSEVEDALKKLLVKVFEKPKED